MHDRFKELGVDLQSDVLPTDQVDLEVNDCLLSVSRRSFPFRWHFGVLRIIRGFPTRPVSSALGLAAPSQGLDQVGQLRVPRLNQ